MIPGTSNSDDQSSNDVTKCPLCNGAVRFFFINYTEKILMCENTYCLFPFGYEDLKFITVNTGIDSDVTTPSLDANKKELSLPTTASSSTAWSSISKLNKSCNSDFVPKTLKRKLKLEENITNNKEINKNVQDLKSLTKELNEIDQDPEETDVIKNEKWIKKLMKLEGLSGVRLVKKEEMELLNRKKSVPVFRGGELKIDIDTNANNMSSINIQIMKKDNT